MEQTGRPSEAATHIDLTDQTQVQYWCGIFQCTMDELRVAVKHAGHQADEVGRYLREKKTGG